VRCAKCKNSWHAAPADVMRKPAPRRVAPTAVRAAPTPPAKAAAQTPPAAVVSFDGELDAQAARDAATLRRSVRGTLDVEEPVVARTGGSPFDEDVVEDDAVSAPHMDDAADSDDFGVSAALKKIQGDDFVDEDEYGEEDHDEDEEYDEDDFLARRRADQRKQSERQSVGRQRKLMTIGLGGLILFWLLVLFAFIFQQENMRHYFPGTSNTVYGLFGGLSDKDRFRPAEGEKLTPSPALAEEYVHALLLPPPDGLSVETRSGKQGLMLRGFIENKGTTGANVPQVQAFILDKNGKVLDSWAFKPVGLILRRGGKVNFEEFRTPIPAGANKAEVKVIEGSKAGRDGRDENE